MGCLHQVSILKFICLSVPYQQCYQGPGRSNQLSQIGIYQKPFFPWARYPHRHWWSPVGNSKWQRMRYQITTISTATSQLIQTSLSVGGISQYSQGWCQSRSHWVLQMDPPDVYAWSYKDDKWRHILGGSVSQTECFCWQCPFVTYSLSYRRTSHTSGWLTQWMKAFGFSAVSELQHVTSSSTTLPWESWEKEEESRTWTRRSMKRDRTGFIKPILWHASAIILPSN